MKIIIKKRSDDWIAYLESNSAFWGCGPSPLAALGDLIAYSSSKFGLEIEYVGS